MIENKEIVLIDNDFALTETVEEVELLDNHLFPKLVFQEFLKQLKIPHLKIEVSNSVQLYEKYPALLEQADDGIVFKNILKYSINKNDLINYYLVCYSLKTDFDLKNIYFDNATKSTLYFQSQMPFTNTNKIEMPQLIKQQLKQLSSKQINQLLERFFILLGKQFEDKLLIYLTFIEAKYKFKLDKKGLIKTVFNPLIFNQLKTEVLNHI